MQQQPSGSSMAADESFKLKPDGASMHDSSQCTFTMRPPPRHVSVNEPSPRDHHHDTTTTHDASQSMHLHHDATTTTPLRRLSRVPSPALRWRSGHLARRQRHCDQGAPHHRLAADVASNGRRTRDTDLLPLLSKPYTAAHIETRTSSRICA